MLAPSCCSLQLIEIAQFADADAACQHESDDLVCAILKHTPRCKADMHGVEDDVADGREVASQLSILQ